MSRVNFQAACLYCDEAVDRRDLADHVLYNHPENVDLVSDVPIAVDEAGRSFSVDVDVKNEVKEIIDNSQVSGAEKLDAAAAVDHNHNSLLELRNPISAEDAVCDGLAAFCSKQKWPSHDVDSDLYAEYAVCGHMDGFKRAQLTLKPDEGSSSAALVASPLADVKAAVDLANSQFRTCYVASGEWLNKAVFALTTSVVASTVTDRQVIVESRPVSAEVARQWWLEEAGMCMVASIACLLKWKEALDAGVVESVGLASELGGDEEREPQDMSLEILNALAELRVKEDVLASLEAAEEESAKRNDKDDDF